MLWHAEGGSRGLEPYVAMIGAGGHSDLAAEGNGEMGRAEIGDARQFRNRNATGQLLIKIVHGFLDRQGEDLAAGSGGAGVAFQFVQARIEHEDKELGELAGDARAGREGEHRLLHDASEDWFEFGDEAEVEGVLGVEALLQVGALAAHLAQVEAEAERLEFGMLAGSGGMRAAGVDNGEFASGLAEELSFDLPCYLAKNEVGELDAAVTMKREAMGAGAEGLAAMSDTAEAGEGAFEREAGDDLGVAEHFHTSILWR